MLHHLTRFLIKKKSYLMDFNSQKNIIRNQPLFYNNKVRFNNKPLLIKTTFMDQGRNQICLSDAGGECMEKL